ncbi:MAG: hypothetical protein ACKVX9_08985 [Blastocatellia bacterium]
MNNGGLARIKYYKGQMLTAKDFDDQQEYHRQKQKHLLRRFPVGIMGGLSVTCEKKKDEVPGDFDGFKIAPGLALVLHQKDNEISEIVEIVVPEPGFKEPVSEFNPLTPYLSLVYFQEETFVGNVLCADNQKHNRIRESFKTRWDAAPNLASGITVALIKPKEEGMTPGPSCDDYKVMLEDTDGGPHIRLDARLVDAEQITRGAITEEKIRNGAVTGEKIIDGAITGEKFGDGAITEQKISDGAVIEPKLSNDIKGKLVAGGSAHDHRDGNGVLIPEEGLHPDVREKLNAIIGKSHNHAGGQGSLIPVKGLALDVLEKLVTRGDEHDHTAKHEVPIPKAGLDAGVQAELVTGGDGHNHTAGHGAPIPKDGLADGAVTREKLADDAVTPEKLNLITVLVNRTFDPKDGDELNDDVTVKDVSPNALIQVIPTAGIISWSFQVEFASANSLNYMIRITNVSGSLAGYQIRAITFN